MTIEKRIEELNEEIKRNVDAMEGASFAEYNRLVDLNLPLHTEVVALIKRILEGEE